MPPQTVDPLGGRVVSRVAAASEAGSFTALLDENRGPVYDLLVGEVASRLGVSESTVRNWTSQGILRAVRLPSGHRRYAAADIERLRTTMFALPPADLASEHTVDRSGDVAPDLPQSGPDLSGAHGSRTSTDQATSGAPVELG